MIRSVHLTNAWHGSSGGIRTFYEALLAGAARHHRHVALIVPGATTSCERHGPFARVYTITAPHSPVFDRRYRLLLPHRFLQTRRSAIWRILAHERPDVMETCDRYVLPLLSGLVRRYAGAGPRPTLVGLSSERMDDNVRVWLGGGRLGEAATRAYLRRVYLPLFDGHIANSEYTARELRDVIATHPDPGRRLASRVRVGPMGVDTEGFSPARRSHGIRRQLLDAAGGGPDTVLLVYAGRVSPEKHVMTLPAMMAALATHGIDARLVVCGDGPLRVAFERAAAEAAPGRVVVLGHVARSQLATVLASADVFVHPNPREPFGIGPLEAMASGLPVVLPRSGGVLSYASDDNAWLTDASAHGLAGGVRDLLARPMMAQRRRAAALAAVPTWAWPAAIDTYFAHYDAIDAERRLSPAPAFWAPRPSPGVQKSPWRPFSCSPRRARGSDAALPSD